MKLPKLLCFINSGFELETFWLHLHMFSFAPSQVGCGRTCTSSVQEITPQRTWFRTSQISSPLISLQICQMWLTMCSGRNSWENWSPKKRCKNLWIWMNPSSGSTQTKYKNNNVVCIGSSVLILLWFVQLCKWSLSLVLNHLRLNPNAT